MTTVEYDQFIDELTKDTCPYAAWVIELMNENHALKQRLGDTIPPLLPNRYGYIDHGTNLLDNMLQVDKYEQIESIYVLGDLIDDDRQFNTASEFLEWNQKCILLMDEAKSELLLTKSIYKLRINFKLIQCTIKLIVLVNRAKKRVQIEYATGGKRSQLLKHEYEMEFTGLCR